jgi:hypothetical protein
VGSVVFIARTSQVFGVTTNGFPDIAVLLLLGFHALFTRSTALHAAAIAMLSRQAFICR